MLPSRANGPAPRWRTWLKELWTQRSNVKDLYDFGHWSERTVIALVMQSLDNSITTYTRRVPGTHRRYLTSRQGHGVPNPTWIPAGNTAVRAMARLLGGTPDESTGATLDRLRQVSVVLVRRHRCLQDELDEVTAALHERLALDGADQAGADVPVPGPRGGHAALA